MPEPKRQTLLEPYRVLDLTEGGYLVAGKILGDLGADVIKIEPHGGSLSRKIGPFYKNIVEPGKSLFWFAYNTNKRSITLDIETNDGKELFTRLVKRADFVLESFAPGYMEKIGLGYETLSKINPRIIMTSITPYGSTGPYSHYRASDLTTWAMGGYLGITGMPDRSPVSVSFPQAFLHAGGYAAAASMIAHWHREIVGEGQHIDVSAQQCIVLALYGVPRWWEFRKIDQGLPRTGPYQRFDKAVPGMRNVYKCKDGELFILLRGGTSIPHRTSSAQLVKYMDEHNMAPDWLKKFNWVVEFDSTTVTQDVIERIMDVVGRFFLTRTKKELYEGALKRRILLAPIANAKDIYENPQLQARDFWVDVEHPELKSKVTYCGPFVKLSEAQIVIKRRPPLIGEHNEEIFEELTANKQETSLQTNKDYLRAEQTKIEGRTTRKQALGGIKVVDFSWSIVGPLTTKHLADYGASVVRVESHTKPETNRVSGPYKDNITGIDRSSLYSLFNTSKYGMSLNMEKTRGKEAAYKLMMWADIVVESFTPGAMRRLGLDYDTISKAKPGIIYVSTSCYGQYGPIAECPGYGQMATAQAGIYNVVGWPDRPAVSGPMPHTDFISPPFLVTAIMAALEYRRRTGRGLYIDQSQVEAGVHFFAPPVMDYIANRQILERNGNRYPWAVPHDVYPCRGENRWCAIAVFTDEEWQRFCDAMNNPPWTREARFATFAERKKNEDELNYLIGQWTINFTPQEVMSLLQKKGIISGVVQTMKELYEDPQLNHLGFWRYLDHPVMGVHAHEGPPFRLSKTPDRQFTSPCIGQHNEYIYKELLGFTDDDIANFVIEGVITNEADIPGI